MFDKVLLSKSFRHTFKNTKVTYLVFCLVLSNLCVFANKSMTSCNETLVRNWPMVSADPGKEIKNANHSCLHSRIPQKKPNKKFVYVAFPGFSQCKTFLFQYHI